MVLLVIINDIIVCKCNHFFVTSFYSHGFIILFLNNRFVKFCFYLDAKIYFLAKRTQLNAPNQKSRIFFTPLKM